MNQKTGWGKINNCALFDYTVTELCFCNGVKNYAKSLNVNSQLQIEKLKDIGLIFVLSNNICKNACKMPSFDFFLSLTK